jgi:RNA polymerase sigma-70 factor (ECF subfamily)
VDDLALVQKAQEGDYEAFELLVKLHNRNVYNLAFRYMREHALADDVVQDTWIKVHKNLSKFRGDSGFKSWLFQITRNTALNIIRRNKKFKSSDPEEENVGEEHLGFKDLEGDQSKEILQKAIEQLPPKQKLALELRVFEELSFKEIASVMDCPFDTAKANYRHALMKLKKILVEKKDDLRG